MTITAILVAAGERNSRARDLESVDSEKREVCDIFAPNEEFYRARRKDGNDKSALR